MRSRSHTVPCSPFQNELVSATQTSRGSSNSHHFVKTLFQLQTCGCSRHIKGTVAKLAIINSHVHIPHFNTCHFKVVYQSPKTCVLRPSLGEDDLRGLWRSFDKEPVGKSL